MKLKLGITILLTLGLVISFVCVGCQAQYETGYEEGYAIGYDAGYDEGREEGYDLGHDVGYLTALSEILASSNDTETENLSASFVITDWDQEYYDYFDEWSDYVEIWYEVENIGNVDIHYYQVYFTVICKDRSEYYDWTNGSDIVVGRKLSGNTMISVPGKEVTSIAIDDWELTHH